MSAQAFSRLARRALNLIGCGRVTTAGDDAGAVQMHQIQFSEQETQDNLRRLSEFGFASNPPVGSDAVVVFIAGDRSNGCIIATGHGPSRLRDLKPGEAALYDAFGKSIYLTKDGGIIVEAADSDVTINAAKAVTINASGNVTLNAPKLIVNGDIEAAGDITAGGISLKTHVHGGVESGPDETEEPAG